VTDFAFFKDRKGQISAMIRKVVLRPTFHRRVSVRERLNEPQEEQASLRG
jgi:hypothetical protein